MAVETGAVTVITGGANGFGRALGDRCAELLRAAVRVAEAS